MAPHDEQGAAKLFEEVKAMVREIPERMDDRIRSISRRSTSKRFLRSPHFIEELMGRSLAAGGPESAVFGWLAVMSIFRDDFPWIYEPGMHFYRALSTRNRTDMRRCRDQMHAIVEITLHEPGLRELLVQMPEDREVLYLISNLHSVIEKAFEQASTYLSNEKRKPTAGRSKIRMI